MHTNGDFPLFRIVEKKLTNEKNAMIDFSYKQGREGMFLDAIIRDIYVCASMEFLLTVVDFFVQANNQVSAVQTNKPTVTHTNEQGLENIRTFLFIYVC